MNNPDSSSARKTSMQTILGAGGVIGLELMRELSSYTEHIRLVRRNPTPPGPGMEAVAADLLDARQVANAVRGSDVAYLLAGLPCRTSVWQTEWPRIMRNVIDACRRFNARLVFFDNAYLYGRVSGLMHEETPVNPCSKKGEVRALIADMLMREFRKGNISGLIARSSEFYGPGATNSFVHPLVFELLRDGKKAVWLANDQVPHSMTYTPDIGRALAMLGNSSFACGQVWHMPTSATPPTGSQFIEQVASAFRVKARHRVISRRILNLAGLFNSAAREWTEMLYQYEEPYLFDSSKFDAQFSKATPYADGILDTARNAC